MSDYWSPSKRLTGYQSVESGKTNIYKICPQRLQGRLPVPGWLGLCARKLPTTCGWRLLLSEKYWPTTSYLLANSVELLDKKFISFYQVADRDFNDVVFLIDFGKDNIATIPEPASAIALMSVGAVGLVLRRRRQNQDKETVTTDQWTVTKKLSIDNW